MLDFLSKLSSSQQRPPEDNPIKDLIESIAKAMVDSPEQVQVNEVAG
jgi:hypothetical protein